MPVVKPLKEQSPGTEVHSASHQLASITENIVSIVQLLGSVSGPATKSLGDVLERSAAALEELNTLSCSITADTAVIYDNLHSIESQLIHLENLWPSIDRAVEFVNQKKQQLSDLERLCTAIERRAAERR